MHDTVPERATHHKTGPILENDCARTVTVRKQLLDAVEIDDCRSVNPNESIRRETPFHCTDLLPKQILACPRVDSDIAPLSFNPVDLFHTKENHTTASLHQNTAGTHFS